MICYTASVGKNAIQLFGTNLLYHCFNWERKKTHTLNSTFVYSVIYNWLQQQAALQV